MIFKILNSATLAHIKNSRKNILIFPRSLIAQKFLNSQLNYSSQFADQNLNSCEQLSHEAEHRSSALNCKYEGASDSPLADSSKSARLQRRRDDETAQRDDGDDNSAKNAKFRLIAGLSVAAAITAAIGWRFCTANQNQNFSSISSCFSSRELLGPLACTRAHALSASSAASASSPTVAAASRVITREELARHNGSKSAAKERSVWVSFRGKVYDITQFIEQHPGGDKIMLAAGGDLEPFWQLFPVHHTPEVQNILASLEIGQLEQPHQEASTSSSASASLSSSSDITDPFALEPEGAAHRSPLLSPVVSRRPFNAEAPLSLLADSFITPTPIFFVRNHLPVPVRAIQDFSHLELVFESSESQRRRQPIRISLAELQAGGASKYPVSHVTSSIMCAGNRRREMDAFRGVKGLKWGAGAISNARWSGVRLVDLLASHGLADEEALRRAGVRHVQFEGLDCDPTGAGGGGHYGASLPLHMALDPRADLLVAFRMNGEPLSADHGAPLRLIAPGCVGAKQVKWLSRIVLSGEESPSFWQRNDYRTFSSALETPSAQDYARALPILEPPVISAICSPAPKSGTTRAKEKGGQTEGEKRENREQEEEEQLAELELELDEHASALLPIKGYAWSGGGRGIQRVELSLDDGQSWMEAELLEPDHSQFEEEDSGGASDKFRRNWAWTLWQADLPITFDNAAAGQQCKVVRVLCKATDSANNSQPADYRGIWNARGLLANGWDCLRIRVCAK